MPYEVQWYSEGRVSVVHYWGGLTLNDMRTANRKLVEHIRSGIPPVHLLIDMREISRLPGTFIAMLKAMEVFRPETNLGWTLLLTNNALLPHFADLGSNWMKMPFASVDDYEAANLLLKQVDPTLDGLLPDQWGSEAI